MENIMNREENINIKISWSIKDSKENKPNTGEVSFEMNSTYELKEISKSLCDGALEALEERMNRRVDNLSDYLESSLEDLSKAIKRNKASDNDFDPINED